ncbi:MAG: protein kinase [bacterium]
MFASEDTKKIDAHYQKSEWDKIIQLLGKRPLKEYDDIRLLNDLAVAFHQLRKFDNVIEVCERIKAVEPRPDLKKQQAELTPRYMRYHAVLGESLYRKNELDKALAIFDDLKAVGSRFSDKYYYSGRIHTKKGNFRLALLEFKGMIANVPARMRDVVRGLGELAEASPAQAGLYVQLHNACKDKDRIDHYLSRFKKEMAESKGSIPAALKVAHLIFLEGDMKSAAKVLASISPETDEEQGWLELIAGDWLLQSKGPDAALSRYAAAEALLPPGDPLITERLEELLHTHKLGVPLRRKLVDNYKAGGSDDAAARHLEAIVAAQPDDQAARQELTALLKKSMNEAFGSGDLERAKSLADRLIKVNPDDAGLISQVQQINQMANLQRKEKLEGMLERRMPAREEARAHFEMAGIERNMEGDEETVLSHLKKAAVERSPVRLQALRQMGQIYLEKGDLDMAEGIHEILFGLRVASEDRLAWAYSIAEACEEKGDKSLAHKYFAQVAEEDATFRDAAGHAGRLARELEEEAAAAAPAAGAAPAAAPAGPPDPMEVLSRRYDDIVELGRGAMGVVYKGRDKILDRQVAIKMILGDIGDDPEALGRFITEAQSAAALEHPGIITIYDIRTEEPMFIVMEFVEGQDVGDLLGGRKLPLDQFLKLAVLVCEPLALAHKAEVIHRDIKPDNIMVTKDGGIKIADFGLSRKGGGSGMTQVGQVMGTPFYMAPEQIRGDEVDGRSDLYALGITFYEMLTGDVPFKEGDIAYMHMHEEPPRLSTKNPEVPKELEDVILKCLCKDPADRYQTVDELLEALRLITV